MDYYKNTEFTLLQTMTELNNTLMLLTISQELTISLENSQTELVHYQLQFSFKLLKN